jgi:hypothetical protein
MVIETAYDYFKQFTVEITWPSHDVFIDPLSPSKYIFILFPTRIGISPSSSLSLLGVAVIACSTSFFYIRN